MWYVINKIIMSLLSVVIKSIKLTQFYHTPQCPYSFNLFVNPNCLYLIMINIDISSLHEKCPNKILCNLYFLSFIRDLFDKVKCLSIDIYLSTLCMNIFVLFCFFHSSVILVDETLLLSKFQTWSLMTF